MAGAIFTTTPGGEEIVILLKQDYESLLDAIEDRLDETVMKRFLERQAKGEESFTLLSDLKL